MCRGLSYIVGHVPRTALRRLTVFLLLMECVAVPGLSQSRQSKENAIPGVILVQYESSAKVTYPSVLEITSMETAFPFLDNLTGKKAGLQSVQVLQRVYRVHYEAGLLPHRAAKIMASQPGVVYAEPQFRRRRTGTPVQIGSVKDSAIQMPLPNDPLFENNAYMERMEMVKAWDHVKGENGEVVIAVVDTGTDWDHPDLLANVWTNPNEIPDNGADDDDNGFVDDLHGWNFANDTGDPRTFPGDEGHGTAVAGAAVAVANNNLGMAGTSWNAKLMSINVACAADDFEYLCSGNDGILYASVNGAQIINLSYGGFKYSRTEELVIQAATDLGSLVVASTQNENIEMIEYWDYPSSLVTSLNVCGTERDSYQVSSGYGYTVDVCTASDDVITTSSGLYYLWTGTSFAGPLVSGIAALVKTRFPEFGPEQVREQIRATADSRIYQDHPASYEGLLGRGYVNAYRAVTETDKISVRMVNWEAANQSLDPQEQTRITATFESFLADAENLTVEFVSSLPQVTFPDGSTFNIGPLSGGEQIKIEFSLMPAADIPYKSFLFVEPRISTSDGLIVSGSDAVRLLVRDTQVALHETATISYTMTSEGNIGYTNFGWTRETDYIGQVGQAYLKGKSFLHEAGLLVGIDPYRVAGSVFQEGRNFSQHEDFFSISPMEFLKNEEGHQMSRVMMMAKANKLPSLKIVQESLVNALNHYEDMALFRYRLKNQSNESVEGVHAGLYFAFTNIFNDSVGMGRYQNGDNEEIFPYMGLTQRFDVGYMGFVVLSDLAKKHYRTYSEEEWYRELFQPEDAWDGLTGGIVMPSVQDIEGGEAQLMASGPHEIAAHSEVVIDFAIVFGEDLDDLTESVSRAFVLRDSWISIPANSATGSGTELPESVVLWGNYPNPVSGITNIEFDLPSTAQISVRVTDLLGRTVKTLSYGRFGPGRAHLLQINADELGAGVYYYTLSAFMEDQVVEQSRAMTIVR